MSRKRPISIVKQNFKCDFLKMAKSGNNSTPNDPLRLKIGWDLANNIIKRLSEQIFDILTFWDFGAILVRKNSKNVIFSH